MSHLRASHQTFLFFYLSCSFFRAPCSWILVPCYSFQVFPFLSYFLFNYVSCLSCFSSFYFSFIPSWESAKADPVVSDYFYSSLKFVSETCLPFQKYPSISAFMLFCEIFVLCVGGYVDGCVFCDILPPPIFYIFRYIMK